MSQIESITLRNFQCHKKLVLKLAPGITTLVGPTDVGKSSVIRALRWLSFNRPSGDDFIRDGSSKTSVTVLMDDGSKVVRRKGKQGNVYEVTTPEQKLALKAFNTAVPTEVSNLLNIGPLNFQEQYDSPFWFSKTAGEVSRQLNEIVDLGGIDTTLSNLASMLRRQRAEVLVLKDRKETARQSLEQAGIAAAIDHDLRRLERLQARSHKTASERQSLALVISNVCLAVECRDKAESASSDGRIVLKLGQNWQKLAKQAESLVQLVGAVQHLEERASLQVPAVREIEVLGHRANQARVLNAQLWNLINEVEEGEAKVCQLRQEQQKASRKFKTTLGDVCPLCGSQVKNS